MKNFLLGVSAVMLSLAGVLFLISVCSCDAPIPSGPVWSDNLDGELW